MEITATTDTGTFEVIKNDALVLLPGTTEVNLSFEVDRERYKLSLQFLDDDTKAQYSGEIKLLSTHHILYSMNKWYSDSFAENETPLRAELTSASGLKKVIFFKIRLMADLNTKLSALLTTIWLQK
jgi:hypothetical protein